MQPLTHAIGVIGLTLDLRRSGVPTLMPSTVRRRLRPSAGISSPTP